MVINPKAAHNFAKVLMSRSKTDAVDAEVLAQYAERMDFRVTGLSVHRRLVHFCLAT